MLFLVLQQNFSIRVWIKKIRKRETKRWKVKKVRFQTCIGFSLGLEAYQSPTDM
jgi:hypothetical protein